jgi:transcriptional regulator with XRE-family HTH domain
MLESHLMGMRQHVAMVTGSQRKELFADRLRRLRHARGMTQEQFAEVAGVSRALIHRLENTRADPLHGRVDSIMRISRVLGCTVDELLRGIEPRVYKRGSGR